MAGHRYPLTGVGLVVEDMAASTAFYRRLGLDIPEDSIYAENGVGHHLEVPMGNGFGLEVDSLELTHRFDPGWPDGAGGGTTVPVALMFSVPSREAVDEVHDDLVAAGYQSHLRPFDAFWGPRYAVVLDPDGYQVGLMSPVEQR